MTFKSLWMMIRTTWQSRPFAIILPLLALAWYWWSHGHHLLVATEKNGGSLPTWQEFLAGAALLTTKWERVTEFFLGAAPTTSPPLPPPVDGPGALSGPKLGLVALLALSVGVSGCATIQPIVRDVETCAGPACADIATKILPAAEVILECEMTAGLDALPACAEQGLSALAAAVGPDGWRIIGCIVNAIERDTAQPAPLRARARAARTFAARKAHGR